VAYLGIDADRRIYCEYYPAGLSTMVFAHRWGVSPRVQNLALDAPIHHGWSLSGHDGAVAPAIGRRSVDALRVDAQKVDAQRVDAK